MYYIEMIGGISGDIVLSLFAQACGELNELSQKLSKMLNTNVNITVSDQVVNNILCKRFIINVKDDPHIHRTFKDIKQLIETAPLKECVKDDAINIFEIIAKAEGKIHGQHIDNVHFHEVGAVDSIIDIVGAAYFYNKLNRPKIISSTIKLSKGVIDSAHGKIPASAPATVEIIKGLPFERLNVPYELTTPTGAAIVKYLSSEISDEISGVISEIYYATGSKTFKEIPNITRLFKLKDKQSVEKLVVVETNIDDMSGEFFPPLMEKLFEEGALDVYFTSIYMKKNRPAYQISVVVPKYKVEMISEIFFRYTSTFGVRFYDISRVTLNRKIDVVEFMDEKVRMKIGKYKDIKKISFEYEDVLHLSKKYKLPPSEIYKALIKKYEP